MDHTCNPQNHDALVGHPPLQLAQQQLPAMPCMPQQQQGQHTPSCMVIYQQHEPEACISGSIASHNCSHDSSRSQETLQTECDFLHCVHTGDYFWGLLPQINLQQHLFPNATPNQPHQNPVL